MGACERLCRSIWSKYPMMGFEDESGSLDIWVYRLWRASTCWVYVHKLIKIANFQAVQKTKLAKAQAGAAMHLALVGETGGGYSKEIEQS